MKVVDVVNILARFEKREDFYNGHGYRRPESGLLNNDVFYDAIRSQQVKRIPRSKDGTTFGMTKNDDINRFREFLQSTSPTKVVIKL